VPPPDIPEKTDSFRVVSSWGLEGAAKTGKSDCETMGANLINSHEFLFRRFQKFATTSPHLIFKSHHIWRKIKKQIYKETYE